MENKGDWEELEKWQETEKQKRIEKYKIDFSDPNEIKKGKQNVDNFSKYLNKTLKIILIVISVIAIFMVFIIFTHISVIFSNAKRRTNADINTVIEQYGTDIKVVSKDIDENENGKYILTPKNNKDIQFTVIKKWGALHDDFKANLQKYIFNSWQSNIKEQIQTEESISENGLLQYENYIVVNEIEKLNEGTEALISFLEYAESWNKENKIVNIWQQKNGQFIMPIDIYIVFKEKEIHPYNKGFQTADEIREEVKNAVELKN